MVTQQPPVDLDVERELLLLTTPDDTEDAPWMVMADLQTQNVELLAVTLRRYIRRQQLPWYLATYLPIRGRRGRTTLPLIAAPDVLVAQADGHRRSSWNLTTEGKAPEFVLEVVSPASRERDAEVKPVIYESMGVREYVIFDPEARAGGASLSGYHRDERGQWQRWLPDERGVLWCDSLGGLGLAVLDRLWIRVVDAQGGHLPTPVEAEEAEEITRRAAEQNAIQEAISRRKAEERATHEALARVEAEEWAAREVAARIEAEAEIARLRAELRKTSDLT